MPPKPKTKKTPPHSERQYRLVTEAYFELKDQGGAPPSIEALSKLTHTTVAKVIEILKIAHLQLASPAQLPADVVERRAARKQQVETMLPSLTEREAEILQRIHGIGAFREYSLEEAAAQLGVTTERARQIYVKALRKAEHPRYNRTLRAFLG